MKTVPCRIVQKTPLYVEELANSPLSHTKTSCRSTFIDNVCGSNIFTNLILRKIFFGISKKYNTTPEIRKPIELEPDLITLVKN